MIKSIKQDCTARLLRHYVSYAVLTIVAGTILYFYKGKRDAITFLAWSSGYISFALLALTLVTGSLNLLLHKKSPLSTHFRRYLGITAGSLAIFHSVTGLFVHLRGKPWLYFLKESGSGYSIRLDKFGFANYTGLFAFLIIIILLATSNDIMLKKLGSGKWKNIQRSSYLMFMLVLVHAYLYGPGKQQMLFFYIPVVIVILSMQIAGIMIHNSSESWQS